MIFMDKCPNFTSTHTTYKEKALVGAFSGTVKFRESMLTALAACCGAAGGGRDAACIIIRSTQVTIRQYFVTNTNHSKTQNVAQLAAFY